MTTRMRWALGLIVMLSGMALYGPFLHNPVFFDDINFFLKNGANNLFIQGFSFSTRWLPYFVTAWIGLIFDDALFAQRGFNLALHLATAYVLYRLVKQVADIAAPHRNNARAAMVAAGLFVLHPLAVYAVGYLIQRTILMAMLFGLLSLSAFVDGLTSRHRAYFILSALFYFLAGYSKEHALLLPAAALALTPLVLPRDTLFTRDTLRLVALPLALYVPIAALLVVQSWGVLGRPYEPFAGRFLDLQDPLQSHSLLWLRSVMTQAMLYFKYLWLALLPYPDWMSVDMRAPLAGRLTEPQYLASVAALAVYAGMAIRWLLRGGVAGMVGYALLAPLLMFGVEFSTVRVQEPFVLYRTYLWMPLLLLSIPVLTNRLPGKIFWPLMLGISLLLAAAATDRLRSFSSGYALWDDVVKKLPDAVTPGMARAYNNRGQENLRRGDVQGAIDDCTRAIAAYEKFQSAYQTRAFAYMKQGNHQAAIGDAQTVARLFPDDVSGYILLGSAYRSAGQFDAAVANFAIACKRDSFTACFEQKITESLLSDSSGTLKP